jgi:two-component system nitrate/nitrite response regulator NarL
MLFREGLRRILYEAGFGPIWCSDSAPVGPLAALSGQVSPLLIIGTEIEEAMVQISEVRRFYPTCRPVLLLDVMSPQQFIAAVHCGVSTVVHKHSSCETLIGTIKLVLDGATVLPSGLLNALLEAPNLPTAIPAVAYKSARADPASSALPPAFGLSERELSVVRWLRDGLSNKEIARRLNISEATVKVHVKAILRKTPARNRTQVAILASKIELEQVSRVSRHDEQMARSLSNGQLAPVSRVA